MTPDADNTRRSNNRLEAVDERMVAGQKPPDAFAPYNLEFAITWIELTYNAGPHCG
jgi:hypothetical protein